MEKINLIARSLGEERLKFNELLKYHTFGRVGGPAQSFYIATTQAELAKVLDIATQLKVPFFIFGNGTKILVSDQGITGLVIKNRTSQIRIVGIKGKVGKGNVGVDEAIIEIDSGVSIQKLNEYLSKQTLKPMTWSSPMNGTMGGTIFIDAGLASQVQKVKVWEEGVISEIEPKELKRQSHIIMSITCKFKAV